MKSVKLIAFGLSLCFVFLIISSCKKNSSFDNYSLLTKGPWETTDIKDEAGNSVIEDCQKDDIIEFAKKSFIFTEGEKDCSEGMYLRSAKWEFKDDGNAIKVTKTMQTNTGIAGAGLVLRYTIITLNETELVLKSDDDENLYYYESI